MFIAARKVPGSRRTAPVITTMSRGTFMGKFVVADPMVPPASGKNCESFQE
jgi:hypothetical protein